MPLQVPVRSPGGWLLHLEEALTQRWHRIAVFDAYKEGDHRLQFVTKRWNAAFAGTFGKVTDNFMPLVIEAYSERMEVQGFRFGKSSSADEAAWDIWQENDCDESHIQLHDEMLTLEEAYWLVEPPLSADDAPRITVEHPSQMIVAYAPGDRTQVVAALKKWADAEGDRHAYANLWLGDRLYRYRSQQPIQGKGAPSGRKINWYLLEEGPTGLPEGTGPPVIPVQNEPTMMRGGRSELDWGILGLQDAVNQIISNLLIGAEYLAFPQRILTGVEAPTDDAGMPIRAWQQQAQQSSVWAVASEQAKASEFTAADLKNYTNAKEALLEDLATQKRLPAPYIKAEAQNISAEALRMTQDGLVRRVRRKLTSAGSRHERMMRLAFLALGDMDKATAHDAEIIWRDPETRSQEALADSLVKLGSIGVPEEVLWERYGFSPQEISRMIAMREAEVLRNVALGLNPDGSPKAVEGVATEVEEPGAEQPSEPVGN